MRITGRFKGYFLYSAHGEFISHRMKVVSSVVVRSQDFRDERAGARSPLPQYREATQANRS